MISNNGLAYSLLKRNCILYLIELILEDLLMDWGNPNNHMVWGTLFLVPREHTDRGDLEILVTWEDELDTTP